MVLQLIRAKSDKDPEDIVIKCIKMFTIGFENRVKILQNGAIRSITFELRFK